jgi:hypothetical protein
VGPSVVGNDAERVQNSKIRPFQRVSGCVGLASVRSPFRRYRRILCINEGIDLDRGADRPPFNRGDVIGDPQYRPDRLDDIGGA